MVVTDLDGTLMRSDRTVGPRDLETLDALGRAGVVRVVATGRSLYSAQLALEADFPIDYLIFSTGAGVVDWASKSLLTRAALDERSIDTAVAAIEAIGLGFMLHAAVPDNHHFLYRRPSKRDTVADFERRLERYKEYAEVWAQGAPAPVQASQLVAIAHETHNEAFPALVEALPELKVVRATSPFDGRSRWLEIFPAGVSKAHAAAWVALRCGVLRGRTVSVGNDYNDEDLLDWTASAFVVANAPEDLRDRYQNVRSNDEHGFTAAVEAWAHGRSY